MAEIRRLRFGTIVRPGEETGDGRPRVEPLLGHAVALQDGWLLSDTGIAPIDPETEAHYAIRRVPLEAALAAAGLVPADVVLVANSHLHFDHVGGNALLPARPVLVQRAELDALDGEGPIAPLVAGADWCVLDGEEEVAPGVRLLPTPGHTPGHQSVLVEGADGGVLLAGQTHDTASGWSADAEAARRPDAGPSVPAWLPALLPRVAEVRFAHDAAVWRA